MANVPVHVGFIMDGNGRWAISHGLPRTVGHYEGSKVLTAIISECLRCGVKVATFFAFSTENSSRPAEEKQVIYKVFSDFILNRAPSYAEENVRIKFVGDRTKLPDTISDGMFAAEEATKHCTAMTVNVAIFYGGQQEIVNAVKGIDTENLTVETLAERLSLGKPYPDLIIRTGGEKRLSNFMLFQAAYSELYFSDTFWPDFTAEELNGIFLDYSNRNRRYGGI